MASRLLASKLSPAVRSRLALPALKRSLATVSDPANAIRTTTLKNGLTVASVSKPYWQTGTVGIWIHSGSRSETKETNGTAHFLEHLAFKGTNRRTKQDIELGVESIGAHLNAYTSREYTAYISRALGEDIPECVDVLADIIQNSKLAETAINQERDVILREAEEVEKLPEEVVFDNLHATAFQNHPLGRTILGPNENIREISRTELVNYIKHNYTADRMVLVSASNTPHEQLVELAEKHFTGLPSAGGQTEASILSARKPEFIGSDVRMRDDTMPTANIAIAVEGVSWDSPDYFTALVTQAIVGNYDRTMGNAPYQGSKLSSFVHKNELANSFMSFSTSYSDTGLWGIYLVTDKITRVDDLVHFALREWTRLSSNVSEAEVERAKAQLKGAMLMSLDTSYDLAEDIGRQLITTGRHMNAGEIMRRIDSITEKDVMDWAGRKLWDQDIAISALGSIEALFDYQRLRNTLKPKF